MARLAIVDSNAAARRQVEAMGYRLTSTWADTDLTPLQTPPTSLARGLQPAPSADVDAAWMSWVSGDLSRVGREMLAFGWRWRTATPPDLREAVRNQAFFQSPAGWAIVEYRQPTEWGIGWLSTTPDSAPELFDDILKTAREAGIERVRIKVPWIPWAVEALQRAGADPDPISVFSIRP